MLRRKLLIALCGLSLLLPSSIASACPFCAAVSRTFSEEIASNDAVVIVKLVELPKRKSKGKLTAAEALEADFEELTAKFEVVKTIKGGEHLKSKIIETAFYTEAKLGQRFLMLGVDPPRLMWTTPLPLTARAEKYIGQILTLPEEGPDRLAFFQNFLEDADELLARDAYDEFAKSPFETVKQLKPRMNHDQLVAWIEDHDIPASRRRLYLTMLGVCGSEADLPMLEKNMKSKDRLDRAGLDALIACYLTLKGSEGMPLVEDLFLKNTNSDYADTYAAIMALRFHGTEADVIPRKRLLVGLRHMLNQPQLADLVIPDLAKWEDWSQMERLVKLFKDAKDSSWVKVPVINYLRACPLPEAKKYIAELEKLDPAAVKRANAFPPLKPAAKEKDKTKDKESAPKDVVSEETTAIQPRVEKEVVAIDSDPKETLVPSKGVQVASRQSVGFWQTGPNRISVICVTWLGGGLLCFVFWKLLWGAGRRES